MPDLSIFWNYANKAGSILLSTGALTYLIKEARKRFVKPDLACSLTVISCITPYKGDPVSDGRGGWLHNHEEDYGIEQICTFTITNLSEHMALRIKLLNIDAIKKNVRWSPEPDYTAALAGFQRLTQEVKIVSEYAGNFELIMAFKQSKTALTNEVLIEYQNTYGRKFLLTFRPNEVDAGKRNVCSKA